MSIPIHVRNYHCEAFAEDDGRMRVRGRLVDDKRQGLGLADGEPLTIHDMVVELYVTMPDFVIDEVDVEMNVRPYSACRNILDDYQQLVGVSITRGYSRRVRELFGGPQGCSHVGALLQALGPVAVQASWSHVTLHEDLGVRGSPMDSTDPEERERRTRLNTNTCHVWREGSEHLTAVSLGQTRRPEWESERLTKLGYDPD
jgi:hypothetical protein